MPKKSPDVERISKQDTTQLDHLLDLEQKAQRGLQLAINAKSRAEIQVATAAVNRAEFLQNIQRRYKLNNRDVVHPKTGVITRSQQPN